MLMDFSVRSRESELLDREDFQTDFLEIVYEDINKCNRWLGGEAITINAVWDLVKSSPKKSYTILDMGCGDGEMMRRLSNFLSKKGVLHTIIGVDLKEEILRIARKKSTNFSHLNYRNQDILKADSSFDCDILINSLTMHHFDEDHIEAFLGKFVELSRVGVVINDLQRSKLAYYLFMVFCFFFVRTKVAKQDGLVSISKAFKKKELEELSEKIPTVIHKIQWKWAFRYLWVMKIKHTTN